MQIRNYLNWRVVLLFVALGPPLGALAWLGANELANLHISETGGAAGFLLGFLLLVVPYSYVFGLVPAALTGMLAPFVWRLAARPSRAQRLVRIVLGSALGAGAAFLFKWLVFASEDLGGTLTLEGVGAVAGATCSAMVRSAWVSPNNSFKPKPLRGSA